MRHLRAESDDRILLTTFSEPLANALRHKLAVLAGTESYLLDRVAVASFRRIAEELFFGRNSNLLADINAGRSDYIELDLLESFPKAGPRTDAVRRRRLAEAQLFLKPASPKYTKRTLGQNSSGVRTQGPRRGGGRAHR
jgi:hypothetical protein